MGRTRFVTIPGPAGRLEGILQGEGGAPGDSGPSPSSRRIAVVCHPHPLGGGSMHTKAVHRTARALEASGHCVLRFNFRGAGASEGRHDHGRGEQEDLGAALGWLRKLRPGLPATVAGYSFGSWVGMKVGCTDTGVDALIGIAVPANLFDFSFLGGCAKTKLFLHGTGDELAPIASIEELYGSIPGPKGLVRIAGGTHLLTESLAELEEAVRRFAGRLPGAAAPSG